MKHGIRQVVLELSLGAQSVSALDAYRRFFEDQVQPLLNTTLDEISSSTSDQHIERIEIDLGTINFDSHSAAWREAVRKAVTRALNHEDTVQRGEIPQSQSLLEQIFFFLEWGRLPWHETRHFIELERELGHSWNLQLSPPSFPEARLRQVIRSPQARTRLLTGLKPVVSTWLIATYLQIDVQKLLQTLGHPDESWALAFEFSRQLLNSPFPAQALATVSSDSWWKRVEIQGRGKSAAASLPILQFLEHFIRVSPPLIPGEAPVTEAVSPPESTASLPAVLDRTIYVNNAGVVLVATFMPTLFETLELLDEHRHFVDRSAQEQAINLVHFLATGSAEAHESDLALAKVLCGLPVETALEMTHSMPAQAIEECEQLLLATIRHWQAVGNTSIDGLRQTFLQREGKLEQLDSSWRLIVEQRGVDVLISSLPWTLGTIRLPWLDDNLQVDWA